MNRASGMTRKYNRKKIHNCLHPRFFHTLHALRCSGPHLRKDAILLENVNGITRGYEFSSKMIKDSTV